MRITVLHDISLNDSKIYLKDMPILEDGEGPRWAFDYDNFNVDPTPDILLLGAYKHPRTRNNLVGGINLHYLNKRQVNKLAKILPSIMSADNLKSRYNLGRRLAPDIFNTYYRTYDSKYIRGVKQSTLYPKYGLLRSAHKWLKSKVIDRIRKPKEPEKPKEPKYPKDLDDMRDRLDKVIDMIHKQHPKPEEDDPKEIEVARQEFQRQKLLKNKRQVSDIDDEQYSRELDDFIDKEAEQDVVDLNTGRVAKSAPDHFEPDAPPEIPIEPMVEPEPKEIARDIEKERQENREELLDADNDVDLDVDTDVDLDVDLEESIIYYSPVAKKYIVESISISELCYS